MAVVKKQDTPDTRAVTGTTVLLPLFNAKFNARECAKQMILLEDHMFHRDRQCFDCINKHILMIEGLADEAISLEDGDKWQPVMEIVAGATRDWQNRVVLHARDTDADEKIFRIAGDVRLMRKRLVSTLLHFADP